MNSNQRPIVTFCLLPSFIFFVAFWLIPVGGLFALPMEEGWETYFLIVTNHRYLEVIIFTFVLSLGVTVATLIISTAIGIYLARSHFFGKKFLLALLTLPLSFPGVIVGFFFILLGGRQGLFAQLSDMLGIERITFAYGVTGLFLAYLYFSLPRSIASLEAAAANIDAALEEAVRSMAGSRWQILRDVWIPQLAPSLRSMAALVFATSMGAFGTAFTIASRSEVLPITIYNEFTNYANFPISASLSISLGLVTWLVLFLNRRFDRQGT